MATSGTVLRMTNPYDRVPNPAAPQQPPAQPAGAWQWQPPRRPEGDAHLAPRDAGPSAPHADASAPQPGASAPQPAASAPRPGASTPAPGGSAAGGHAAWQAPSTPHAGPGSSTPAPGPYGQHHDPRTGAFGESSRAFATASTVPLGAAGHGGPGAPWQPAGGSGEPPRRRRAGLAAGALAAAVLLGGAAGFGGGALFAAQNPQQPSTASGQTVQGETVADPQTIADVAATAGGSVVTVQAASQQGSGEGSGVVIAAGGYIVTNNHVVTLDGATANANVTVQTSDGRLLQAEVVGTDPTVDLAVLKVDAELPVVTFASSDDVRVGDTAIAIGAPLGLSNSVTDGIVSAVDRGLQVASSEAPSGDQQQSQQSPFGFWQPDGTQAAQEDISIPVVQTDASINPGNSGGALLNASGQLIGVNVAIASMGSSQGSGSSGSIGIGFAIEASLVQRVVQEIIDTGAASHGLLGASVSDVTDASVGTVGAQIQELSAGGAAEAAGLRAGDVITAVDGAPVTNAVDATAQVRAHAGGTAVTITYVRDGQEAEAEATLGTLE
ncbi:hypothetical protein GCM10010968_10730 [Agrococcus terreus]|uniref:PDZ domain-containing protein n=2 Tax=Agrococcus terreus TaxID=574649 RepID=A0ABQ2KHR0_9MICO|nr:hypothetical protein GCM10010968_10730 [Agrococcus terreus]